MRLLGTRRAGQGLTAGVVHTRTHIHTHTHTHTLLSHSLTHARTLSRTQFLSPTPSLSHTHTLLASRKARGEQGKDWHLVRYVTCLLATHSHTLFSHTHSHSHILSHILTHLRALSHTLTHTRTHTHTHTLSLTHSLSLPPSLTQGTRHAGQRLAAGAVRGAHAPGGVQGLVRPLAHCRPLARLARRGAPPSN